MLLIHLHIRLGSAMSSFNDFALKQDAHFCLALVYSEQRGGCEAMDFMILASTPEDIQEAMNSWIVYLISYPMLKPKEAEVMEI